MARLKIQHISLSRIGYIITLVAVCSLFLGKGITLNLGFFSIYLLRILGIVGVLFILLPFRSSDPFMRQVFFVFVVMWCYAVLSIVWAPNKWLAIEQIGIMQTGITFVLMLVIFVNTEQRLKAVLKIWAVGAFALGIIGIWEVTNQTYLLAGVAEKRIVFAEQFGFFSPLTIFPNINNYAFFNSITGLIFFSLVMKRNVSRMWYVIFISVFLMSTLLMLYSYSRAAIGCYVLSLLVFMLLSLRSRKRRLRFLLIFAVSVIGLVVYLMMNPALLEKVLLAINAVTNKSEVATDSNSIRTSLYIKGLYIFLESFGWGGGAGASYTPSPGNIGQLIPMHNFYLQILAEYGLIIFCLYMFLLVRSYLRLKLWGHTTDSYLPFMFRALLLASPLLLIGPSSVLGEGAFWLWIGLTIAQSLILYKQQKEKQMPAAA